MSTSDAHGEGERAGRRLEFRGVVQGVGFRPWFHGLATSLGVAGSIRNDASGVTVEAFGTRGQLEALVERARREAPRAAVIEVLRALDIPAEVREGFVIAASAPAESAVGLRISIPPDLAICPECLAEVFDPSDRRYRYPFINCTQCGPRHTILRDIPYDRSNTTMAAFRMCEACQREYDDPSNRRFHAEPNACPRCGPCVELLDAVGCRVRAEDPLAAAGVALRRGAIVAVKGVGGFHLACDARSSVAVARLRTRKGRYEKPLAVMVEDLAAADRLAVLSGEERELLASVERPIVIVRRADASGLAPEVSKGAPTVGLLLAYTPLHHILLRAAGRPLVMTSGNASNEPIVIDDAEAVVRLADLADLFIVHDRVIEARADDSVVRIIAGRASLLRRSRGYVPRSVAVRGAFPRPVLAVGGHLKNTFAIGTGEAATLGPHVGDLETVEAYAALEAMVARMERFLDVVPRVIARDLHPEYLSTRYAKERATDLGAPLVAVQHHHAHVVSAMAEHDIQGPVLGLAWDGTGLGADGTSWGGELLLATPTSYERLATFRAVPLAGGERAVREVWRTALALVDDAFDGSPPIERIPALAARTAGETRCVREMIASGLNAPLAHGVGRLFDAVGALVLGHGVARYEAQVPAELEWVAAPEAEEAYPFAIDFGTSPWEVDTRPLVRALVADVLAGACPRWIAARFHESLGAIAHALLTAAVRRDGGLPVVLTGGCFNNARLVDACLRRLVPAALDVRLHVRVPAGDGGLALGQAVVADARIRAGGCV